MRTEMRALKTKTDLKQMTRSHSIEMTGQQQWQSLKIIETGCPAGWARVWKLILNINIQNQTISVQGFTNCQWLDSVVTHNFFKAQNKPVPRKKQLIDSEDLKQGYKH